MGDTHAQASDNHLHPGAMFVPHGMPTLDMHDHDFAVNADFDSTAHHGMSPFSMHITGTLSRPASMASMTNFSLPPNSLSRVGSLSNLHAMGHNMHQQNFYFAPPQPPQGVHSFFSPPYQMTSHQQHQQNQQQSSPNQMMGFPIIGTESFRGLTAADYSTMGGALKQNQTTKPKKAKQSNKRAAAAAAASVASDPAQAHMEFVGQLQHHHLPQMPPAKAMKMEKSVKKERLAELGLALESPKQQRSRNPSSAFRGVSKCSKDGRWQARIRVKRQVTYLGRFVNEEDAAKKYDEAARAHHGDKAVLNFPTAQDKQLGRKQATSAIGGGAGDDDDDEDGGSDE